MKSIVGSISAAATAIRNSSVIATFCSTKYSKTITLFLGEDKVNPPTEEDAPFVVFQSSAPYEVGSEALTRNPSFELDWAVKNSTTTAADSGKTITQDGLTNSDVLGMLIVDALVSAFSGSNGDHFTSAKYMLYGDAPLWCGGMVVTLNYEQGLGEA